MTKNELGSLTITELKALAKKKKVDLPSGARKADIVSALLSGTAKKGARAAAGGRPAAAKEVVKAANKKASSPTAKVSKAAGTVRAKKKVAAKRPTATGPGATVPASAARPAARKAPEPEWRMPAGRGGPFTAQERVTGAKFYTGTAETGPAAAYDALPHEYGRERIVLLPRDPHTVFAFWEVSERHLDAERKRAGGEARLCVRIFDVTGVPFDGKNEIAYFDQEVYERVGSWYFNLDRPGRAFCADLGVRSPEGGFLTLLRSNTISVPRVGFSEVLDDAWAIPVEEFLRLYGVAGHGGTSSAQILELMRKRRLLEISSPGQWGKAGAQTRRR